jgi:hypothetical protein
MSVSVAAGDAAQAAPQLATGLASIERSRGLWRSALESLPELRTLRVTPSTLHADTWCLLVPTNADAAKLRQCAPTLREHAKQALGVAVEMRVKVTLAP